MQDIFNIGKVTFPIVAVNGYDFYPVDHMIRKVLKRKEEFNMSDQEVADEYGEYVLKLDVEFVEGEVRNVNCISKTGLIKYLKNVDYGKLNDRQIKNENKLHKFLGIELIPVDGKNERGNMENGGKNIVVDK
jgi:hypothetical protein